MKVKPEHVDAIREAIKPLDTDDVRDAYRARNIPRGEFVQDIDKRYRWDLFSAANRSVEFSLTDMIYPYANDTHIDTALRSVVVSL